MGCKAVETFGDDAVGASANEFVYLVVLVEVEGLAGELDSLFARRAGGGEDGRRGGEGLETVGVGLLGRDHLRGFHLNYYNEG